MSEEKALEILADLCSALEAAAVDAKRRIGELTSVKEAGKGWDPSGVKWEQAEGSKGPFERSDDFNNPEHKAMVKDLVAHNGRLTREGSFYWLFENGATVGRKKRKSEPKAEVDVVAQVEAKFPAELKEILTFEVVGEYIVIKPRQYLGSENFAKIASIVRGEGGEYISAGKESHFRIKKGR